MAVITITSDWSHNDYYLAAVKGQLLRGDNKLKIVDLNNQITPFNSVEAAFIIRNSYTHFPDGSVHINFVNAEPGGKEQFLAIKANNHFFIGNDNGTFSLILKGPADEAVQLEPREPESYITFPGLFTFTWAAQKIIQNKSLKNLGTKTNDIMEKTPFRAAFDENSLTGKVIYIDSYGNVITNITKELFDRIGKKQPFEIFIQSSRYRVNNIKNSYNQVAPGEMLAVFNSAGLLEIAINSGSARKLLKLELNSIIRIKFIISKTI